MLDDNEKKIQENFTKLPQSLKDVARSPATKAVIQEIAKACALGEEGTGELENVTLLVILGITAPKDFVTSLKKIPGMEELESDEVRSVAQEINRRIFRPVREELKKLHGIDDVAAIQQSIPEDERMDLEPQPINPVQETPNITFTPPPRPRPLDAELMEGAGLRVPEPPRFEPIRKTLDAELSDSLRAPKTTPATPVPPSPIPPPRPQPSFTAPRKESTMAGNPTPPQWSDVAQKPSFSPAPTLTPFGEKKETLPPAWNTPPSAGLREFMKPALQQGKTPEDKAMPPKPTRTYANPLADNHFESEEQLSREEILRGIENPSSIPSKPTIPAPIPQPPKQYGTDPYREPLE